MTGVPIPENKLIETIRALQEEVENLRKGGYIPRLQSDPPAESNITIWMLHDGRLRGRKVDGSIQEWAKTEHTHPGIAASVPGGQNSTAPVPPAPHIPQPAVLEVDADWSQTYSQGGSTVYNGGAHNALYYGQWLGINGEFVAMIHFPGLEILTSQARITGVAFRLSNVHTYSNAGGDLYIGFHNSSGEPTTFQQTMRPPIVLRVGKPSPSTWYTLPEWVGEAMRDRQISGITFHQASTSRALYGYAAGVGSDIGTAPRLRINYVS